MKRGKLVVLSAPSGTGKTSICKELLKRNEKWKFSISATTRQKRSDEVDGVDYHFMSLKQFEHKESFGEFLEWEFVHGNRYGTLTDPLYDSLKDGDIMLLDIDVVGGRNIMEEFPDDTLSIFIEPPGLNIAEQKIILDGKSPAIEIAKIFQFNQSLILPIDTKILSEKHKSYIASRPKHSGLNIDKVEKDARKHKV